MTDLKVVPNPKDKKIVLTYKDINNQAFIQGLRMLVNHKWDAFTTAYRFKRLMDKVDSESKKAFSAWDVISKTQIEWEGEGKDAKPKDIPKYQQFEAEFLATEFDCGKWHKFSIQELLGVKLSAVDLGALEPIIDGLDELEEAANEEDSKENQKN